MNNLFQLVKEKRDKLTMSVVLSGIGSIFTIVPYLLIYLIIELYINNSNVDYKIIWKFLLIGLGAIVIKYIFTISAFVFSHIAAFDLLYKIRTRITAHLGTLPMGYWNRKHSGDVRKVIQEDVESIENFIAHHIPDVVSGIVLPITTLLFLYFVDWRLALAATIPLPIGAIMIYIMFSGGVEGKKRSELLKKYHNSMEEMNSRSVEFVNGMPVIKVFNITVDRFKKLKIAIELYGDLVTRWSRGLTPYYAIFASVVLGGGIFILPFGYLLLSGGSIEVSQIILFLLLGTGCLSGLTGLMHILGSSQVITEGGERITQILNEKPMSEPENPRFPNSEEISINNLSFKYSETGENVLKNINLKVPKGSFTALVGPSGGGKSTIVQLISRMWETQGNEIEIGGIHLSSIGTKGINSLVGTVFQDVSMLTATVKENILMDSINTPHKKLVEAAKAAGCHDFIESLPNGYNTTIGEGGETHLSGGEKQRIALARVIIKNPPIILLDEATAYADAENETLMQESFSKLMKDKTVIVIAHRLSTIVNADNIVVIKNGSIEQQGAHRDLLSDSNSTYRNMWESHNRAKEWQFNSTQERVEVTE